MFFSKILDSESERINKFTESMIAFVVMRFTSTEMVDELKKIIKEFSESFMINQNVEMRNSVGKLLEINQIKGPIELRFYL